MSNLLARWLFKEAKDNGIKLDFELEEKNNDTILKIANRYNLKVANRNRNMAYQRFYFSWHLQNILGYRCTEISRLIGKDHASVIYGVKEAEYFMEVNNSMFLEIVNKIRTDLTRLDYEDNKRSYRGIL